MKYNKVGGSSLEKELQGHNGFGTAQTFGVINDWVQKSLFLSKCA